MQIDMSKLAVITSPKLFTDNNYERIDEDGLLSQRIFGPLKSYHCLCGLLKTKTLHAGKRCTVCGVLCADSDMRHTQFSKIVLPFPTYKNIHKNRNLLRRILKKSKYLIDPTQADLSLTDNNYLNIQNKTGKIFITKTFIPHECIPLKITGIYTLYIAILVGYKLFKDKLCKYIIENIFTYELLVTPPGTRHVFVKTENGLKSIIQNSLNTHYSRILRLCSFDWLQVEDPKSDEDNYVEQIKLEILKPNPIPITSLQLKNTDQMIYL